MPAKTLFSLVAVLWLTAVVLVSRVGAQFDPGAPEPIDRVRGTLYLHGGGRLTEQMRRDFLELAGGASARLVVIPSADPEDPTGEEELDTWRSLGAVHVRRLHAFMRDEAERPEFAATLDDATGVWICGGKQSRLARAYLETPVEAALRRVVARGGVVGGTSAGAAITSRVMLVYDEIRQGLDLVPGAIVDQHYLVRRREERLRRALMAHPDRVGLGIDEATVLILRGRTLTVRGESTVTLMLAASPQRPERVERLKPGERADLIAWSRAAVARQRAPFPTAMPPLPRVAQGSLVIVGGGGMPKGLMRRFIDLAGGVDAPIVYVPCEEVEHLPEEPSFVAAMRKLGARQVSWIHTKDRRVAREDAQFLKPLETARGVWFGGGRQWNLVDSYQHTTAHRLMHAVLERGGVIGGSSAGASIQGDYMPRGDPLGNLVMMAEGYESGLGFLTGVAIDQHFSQRKRFADMTALVKTYPQLLGIGIDEATALVVRHDVAEVVGNGKVAFYDARRPRADGEPDYVQYEAGQFYDLVERQPVEP